MALSSIYIYYAVRLSHDSSTDSENEYYTDLEKTGTIQWIISAIFTVMMILMSLSLMFKLRIRFFDFYTEYGCFLWSVFTIQALSLLIMTTIKILLLYNDAVIDYKYESNSVFFSILQVIYHIFIMVVPMITQLSCLIFGWIRQRREAN